MHAPLRQKADSFPNNQSNAVAWSPSELCTLVGMVGSIGLLRNATFVRTFLWSMLPLQHQRSSSKWNYLSAREKLWSLWTQVEPRRHATWPNTFEEWTRSVHQSSFTSHVECFNSSKHQQLSNVLNDHTLDRATTGIQWKSRFVCMIFF